MKRAFALFSFGPVLLLAVALPLKGEPGREYAGAQACAKCHATIHRDWIESRHARMMRPATQQSVQGDFAQGKVSAGGSIYVLRQANGAYFITESDLSGRPWEHRVEYTLGDRRVQHYLTTLPDGRTVVIPATWDNVRKLWTRDVDIENPEEPAGGQVWNRSCYGCHVSREQKNFDLANLRYRTTWQGLGIDCESCHGPGSEHLAKPEAANIINPKRLDAARGTMVCASCHSVRDIYSDGFRAGENYYDFYMPVMEYRLPESDNPAFWPDGRPRWFANEAIGLWQSQCYLKGGATCATCHSQSHDPDPARDPQLRADSNALCSKCHATVAVNIGSHSHHAPKSAGASCIGCHMPATVVSLKTQMRDHSLSVPVPENTVRHGIPNACNICHKDRDAGWASRQMTAWWGDKSRRKLIRRADAFAGAKKGEAASIPALLQILSDLSGGPWIRANAAGYLGEFPNDPSAYDGVVHAFSDSEPLVRATAVSVLRPRAAQRETAAPAVAPLLADPVRTVRMSAAIALVAMGVRRIPGEDGERFERAKDLYRARAEFNSDDAQQQFAAGKFFFLAGDMDGAAVAFQAALKLDPEVPAGYLLARALNEKGDYQQARRILQTVPRDDPQYGAAQRLLAEVEVALRTQEAAPSKNAADAEAKFLDGQLQYQSQYYEVALKQLDDALRLKPDAAWASKAQVYRAICLEKLARTDEAEAAMKALSVKPEAIRDVDLQVAFIELLYDTARAPEALKRADALIAAVPNAPMAHFWRAKVLVQLHRAGEAAAAAEESIRLMPQVPNAHNLLIRIYQMQGRAKEAAEQAEWLRDYERRLKSR